MLISNYEGVLDKYKKTNILYDRLMLYRDLWAIKDYIKNGGTFLLMTKYKPGYIFNEIDRFKIPYNYVSYYNGLVTLDNKGDILNSYYIDKDTLLDLKEIINKLCLNNNVLYYGVDGLKELNTNDDVVLIDFNINVNNLSYISKYIKDYNLGYTITKNGISIFKKINKPSIVEDIKEKTKTFDITMISDSKSDLELLTKYDGYCIRRGNIDNTNVERIKTVPNIKSLIKKINK